MQRTVIVGDIHGCLTELNELLELVGFRGDEDALILLGDYFDRGPDSTGVLRLVRELAERHGAVALMGNHDEKYLRWHRWQTTPPPPGSKPMFFPEEKARVYAQLTSADLDWLAARPYYHQGDGFLAVHAGISPLKHRTMAELMRNRESRSLLVRIRQVDAQGNALKLGDVYPPDARPWWHDYDGRFGVVFYGHQHAPDVVRGRFSVGLDTGCCFGGQLTAAVFSRVDQLTFSSVKARSNYHPTHEEEAE